MKDLHKRDLYDYIGTLAMITTPIAAAVFFGWHAWSETLQLTGDVWLSRLAAIATAVTLEAVGMYAGHMAISLYPQRRWLYGFAALVLYTAVGVIALWGTVGMFAFLLAPVVYGLVALRHDARAVQTEQRETAHVQTERQWTLEDRREERQHQLEMKRLELEASTKLAVEQRVLAQPAQSGYECPQCHDTFGSQQAVNAHQRWCTATIAGISANGSGK